jgi:hypothetical protein
MKKIDPKKQKGLAKLKKKAPEVVAKMGYYKKGGRAKMMEGGVVNHAQLTGFGAVRPEVKKFGK